MHAIKQHNLLFFQRFQILLPFHRQEIFFSGVALLARRDEVSLHGPASAHNRYQMVHGKFRGLEPSSAVIATAAAAPALPPLRSPELARPGLFPLYVVFVNSDEKIRHSERKTEVRSQRTEDRQIQSFCLFSVFCPLLSDFWIRILPVSRNIVTLKI